MMIIPRLLLLAAAALSVAGCATGGSASQVRTLETRLEPLKGESPEDVGKTLTEQLGFRLMSKWSGMSPTPETIARKTPSQAKFSPQEGLEAFRENGFYDVIIFVRSEGEEKMHSWDGEPDEILTYHAHTHMVRSCVLARLVFRDKRLQAFKLIRVDVSS